MTFLKNLIRNALWVFLLGAHPAQADFGLPPSEGIKFVHIINRGSFPVDVWLDGTFQGHCPSNRTASVPKEGFVTLDSGHKSDGSHYKQHSYGGWLTKENIAVFLFAILPDGTPKYWQGTIDGDYGPDAYVYFDGPEPEDIEFLLESSGKLSPNAMYPKPESRGISPTGKKLVTEADLKKMGDFQSMVGSPNADQQAVPSDTSIGALMGSSPSKAATPAALKMPVKGDLSVAQRVRIWVRSPLTPAVTTTLENYDVKWAISGNPSTRPIFTLNGKEVSFKLSMDTCTAKVPLEMGENHFIISVKCPIKGERTESFTITRNPPPTPRPKPTPKPTPKSDTDQRTAELNTWVESGGYGITKITISPKPNRGATWVFSYDFYSIPDSAKIYYETKTKRTRVLEISERGGGESRIPLPAHQGQEVVVVIEGRFHDTTWKFMLEDITP